MSMLKRCPFCGGKAYYRNTVEFTSVRCQSCSAETKICNTEDAAFASWNRRSDGEAAKLRIALDEVYSWLCCAAIASNDDMAQGFEPMQRVCEKALGK